MVKSLLIIAALAASLTVSAGPVKKAQKAMLPLQMMDVPALNELNKPLFVQQKRNLPALRANAKKEQNVPNIILLTGEHVATVYPYSNVDYPSCNIANITMLGKDSINISKLIYGLGDIHAKVDLKNNKIEIPSQVAFNDPTYGKCSIVAINDTVFDRTKKMGGFIGSDGSIFINTPFVVLIDSGKYAGYYIFAILGAVVEKPNGTLSYSVVGNDTIVSRTDKVAITQYNDSMVNVANFGGFPIEMKMKMDSSVVISSTKVYNGGDDEGVYFIVGQELRDSDIVATADSSTLGSGKGDATTIKFNPFTFSSTKGYWSGLYDLATLKYTNDSVFHYPPVPAGIRSIAVNADRKAEQTMYYNAQGQQSTTPFRGFNIAVTRFSDGTAAAKKFVKR